MKQANIFYWQPKNDYLKIITSTSSGRYLLIVLNYLIWIFLFYISFLLIKSDINNFWRILFATITSEVVERYLKSRVYWTRPMFVRHSSTPTGLVDKWYKTGSFPSGHTIKAVFFLLFVISSGVFPIPVFLAITLPLIFFRVIIGFHYPIDLFGGIAIGIFVYLINSLIIFPSSINNIIQFIFNTVFFIK